MLLFPEGKSYWQVRCVLTLAVREVLGLDPELSRPPLKRPEFDLLEFNSIFYTVKKGIWNNISTLYFIIRRLFTNAVTDIKTTNSPATILSLKCPVFIYKSFMLFILKQNHLKCSLSQMYSYLTNISNSICLFIYKLSKVILNRSILWTACPYASHWGSFVKVR